MTNKLDYTLQLADNASIIGHRLGEWCGHGPIIEQDIALTNISLDHIGRARSLYQYAADQLNQMPVAEKNNAFLSVALQNVTKSGANADEDDLAFLRDAWDFRNLLLLEQPNKDWAYTVARSFYYDTFNYFFFTALQNCKDTTLVAIAEKSLKEVTYHLRWSSEWVIRLGDGTEESHQRMQDAITALWPYTGEMFLMNATDTNMVAEGIAPNLAEIKQQWKERVDKICGEANITLPTNTWMQQGGKDGKHSEHLGFILADMQFMQRTYPNMEW